MRWRSRRRSTAHPTEQHRLVRPPADAAPTPAAEGAAPATDGSDHDAATDDEASAPDDEASSPDDEASAPVDPGDTERLFDRADDAGDDTQRWDEELWADRDLRSDDERAAAWLSAVAEEAHATEEQRRSEPPPAAATPPPAAPTPPPAAARPAETEALTEPVAPTPQPPAAPPAEEPGDAAEPPAPSPTTPAPSPVASEPAPAPAPPAPVPSEPAPVPAPSGPAGRVTSAPPADEYALAAARRDIVRRALDEDLSLAGDVTALATVPPDAAGMGRLVARARGVVAGLDAVAEVYDQLDPRIEVRLRARDGDRVDVGDVVAEVQGPLRSVLTGERTALNLVTHLSGVATVTAAYVDAVAGTACEVRDTRKTTPGLRLLEKAAVRAGGGANHRVGLSDAILVKENHVAAAGGVGAATRAAIAGARDLAVQVEVETLAELDEAVAAGARDVLLDNFDVATTRAAVARVGELADVHGRVLLESSGGLDLQTVAAYAAAGVDRVAVGALTHSAPQLDLALEVVPSARA